MRKSNSPMTDPCGTPLVIGSCSGGNSLSECPSATAYQNTNKVLQHFARIFFISNFLCFRFGDKGLNSATEEKCICNPDWKYACVSVLSVLPGKGQANLFSFQLQFFSNIFNVYQINGNMLKIVAVDLGKSQVYE